MVGTLVWTMQLTTAKFRHQWQLKQQSSAAGRFVCIRVIQSFDCHVHCQIHQQNDLNAFFSASTLSIGNRAMLLNLLLLMEFMKNVFTNFLVENLFSHEVLVTGRVTAIKIKLNFVSSYKLKKLVERCRWFRLLAKPFFARGISSFK